MIEMVNNMYSSMENHFYSEIDLVVANQFPTRTRLSEYREECSHSSSNFRSALIFFFSEFHC